MAKRLNDTIAVAATPMDHNVSETVSTRKIDNGFIKCKSTYNGTESSYSETYHPNKNPAPDAGGGSMKKALDYLERTNTV